MHTTKFPEVMNSFEVMEYLRISKKTLLKLVHDRVIPAGKVGKNYRYLKSEVDRYLKGETINYFKN